MLHRTNTPWSGSHTDTHSSCRPQNHLWVLLKASDQQTLRPASSCHRSGPSRGLLLLVFLPVQVSGGSTVCLCCWNSAELPAAAAGWRLITCCEWCHLNHYLVVRLATPPPTLLHSRPVGETTHRVPHDSPWRRWGRQTEVRSGFETDTGNNQYGGEDEQDDASLSTFLHITELQFEHVQYNFLAYIICTFTGNRVFLYCGNANVT